MPDINDIQLAAKRIEPYTKNTPIVSSSLLNEYLGQKIFFKVECLQKTGSFKIRGATNFILSAVEQNPHIDHIIANSSGNHAQAVAYIGSQLGIKTTIFASQTISPIKAAATRAYGATLHTFENRPLADKAVEEAAFPDNTLWVPPFNHPHVIAGQGTAAVEALTELNNDVEAVFAPCGGGGLLSGSIIATRALAPNAQVIGAEPLNANDACRSLRSGKIEHLIGTPNTLADGAATPAVGEHTFPFLQQLDDLIEVDEQAIVYWTQWLHHLLKFHIEPTCAMTMEAVKRWAAKAPSNSRALVMLSGGNISQASMAKLWQHDYLNQLPSTD
jgi:threonine dehydratase